MPTKIIDVERKQGIYFCSRGPRLAILTALMLSVFHEAQAEDTFNVNALEIDNPLSTPVDLSQFSNTGNQAPGTYRVDIYINGEQQETRDVTFVASTDGKLEPQLTVGDLAAWGVMLKSIPVLADALATQVITNLSHVIPQGSTQFDFSHQKLNITIPQALMRVSAQGAVDPKYWDEGMSALLLNYSFTGANTWGDNRNSLNDNYFLQLHSGINLGGWRFRNYSTWTYNNENNNGNNNSDTNASSQSWNSINTYVQHNIPAIRGQFIGGDSYTPSDVFDSIQFRGAQLASDDNMLPESLRGFAPTIRGIANSNAQITVKQNGAVIYQTYVPPGAFTISDLFPTSSSGDLLVTIKEANGSERTFS